MTQKNNIQNLIKKFWNQQNNSEVLKNLSQFQSISEIKLEEY